jgi:outer membrane protein OmpA-like peptidoglycan-associated protein
LRAVAHRENDPRWSIEKLMPQSVDKLKELLFDSEARALDILTQRVDSVEHLTLDERRLREEIARRIDAVFDRAGSADRFEVSVAEVLDGALRRAEVDRHTELASAMAPVVVRTVKTEIRNSRDELVEALYPMMGRMVQAYVASAMKDLAKDINRRLEQNPVMLRLRSIAAGKSPAEIAIADSQRLVVEELYLIRRGSGELVGRWPPAAEGSGSRDHVMSGVLTAINEFSTEALKDDGSALRQIDLGERQLYLRVSPTFLLAAKCSGSAPQPVEAVLDQSFLEAMEQLQKLSHGDTTATATESTALLENLSQNLGTRLDQKNDELAEDGAGISPLKLLAWIIGVPLAGWLSWTVYADFKTERARTQAANTLSSVTEMAGYPVSLDVSRFGSEVTISGLAPAPGVKDAVVARLREALPGSLITDKMSVLPDGLAGIEPRIASVKRDVSALTPEVAQTRDAIAAVDPKIESVRARIAGVELEFQNAAVTRAIDRTELRLREAKDVMGVLAASQGAPMDPDALRRTAASIDESLAALAQVRTETSTQTALVSPAVRTHIATLSSHIHDAEKAASGLGGFPIPSDKFVRLPSAAAKLVDTADGLAAQADRLASISLAAAQVIAVKRSIPPPAVIPAAVEPTPRERLLSFAQANAIFFTNEVDFRVPKQAGGALDELAKLMRGNDVLLRVVGYTDNQGTPERNAALSGTRAQTVIDALTARGVAANRLVPVGRIDTVGISRETGASSPNRRVEFEVGFIGENVP